jgi:hypothetical protein
MRSSGVEYRDGLEYSEIEWGRVESLKDLISEAPDYLDPFLAFLPNDLDRETARLYWGLSLSQAQIADILHVTQSGISSRLVRLEKRIRVLIQIPSLCPLQVRDDLRRLFPEDEDLFEVAFHVYFNGGNRLRVGKIMGMSNGWAQHVFERIEKALASHSDPLAKVYLEHFDRFMADNLFSAATKMNDDLRAGALVEGPSITEGIPQSLYRPPSPKRIPRPIGPCLQGVVWSGNAKRWVVRIYLDGKKINCGIYRTMREAGLARDKVLILKHHGGGVDYRDKLNFDPKESENFILSDRVLTKLNLPIPKKTMIGVTVWQGRKGKLLKVQIWFRGTNRSLGYFPMDQLKQAGLAFDAGAKLIGRIGKLNFPAKESDGVQLPKRFLELVQPPICNTSRKLEAVTRISVN